MAAPIHDHNQFYLSEDRKLRPKEYFKFLVGLAQAQLSVPNCSVLDIGCATGEYLYYLKTVHPFVSATGVDISRGFLERAREIVPDAEFIRAEIGSGANLPEKKFDVVFMSGVNYLFTDFEPWLRHVISLTAGSAYVFGVFNPEDLDVRAVVTRSGDITSQTPWNLISQKSISLFLDHLPIRHRFIHWELPIAIPRRNEDPIRSWTLETKDGKSLVVNGMQLIHRFAVLQIDVAE